jgi:hypothetical protein
MKEYKNILIEIDDKDLKFENPVKVIYNHQSEKNIGFAILTNKHSGLYADIILMDELPKIDHYPSLGFKRIDGKNGSVVCLGISTNQNIDNRIPKI